MRPLSCRRARALVVASRDGGLRLEARLALDAHLADCQACRALDARDAALEEALARLEEPPVERLDLEAAVRAVRAGIAQRERRALERRRRLRPIAIAVALAAGLALALALLRARPAAVREAPRLVEHVPEQRAEETALAPREIPPEHSSGDVERLAAARTRCAEAFDAALALDADVEARLAALDGPLSDLAREGWPVPRLVERQLDVARPGHAALAARWLGRADDRLSVAAVAALVRDVSLPFALRAAALEALLDSRDTGAARREALLEALDEDALRARALHGLAAADDVRLAGELRERLLARRARDGARDIELCAELARRADAGIDALVAVAAQTSRPAPRSAALATLTRDAEASARLARLLDERADRATAAARLRVACELGLAEALAAVRREALDRGTRDTALEALALHPDASGWDALFELWDEGRVPEAALLASARARLERDRGLALALASGVHATAALEVLLALEAPATAPHLVQLAAHSDLALDQRQWALEAVCELGGEGELEPLGALLRACGPEEARLAAACALALFRIGGRDALAPALEAPATARDLCALFESRPADRNRSVTLSRASRRLEPWLAADPSRSPRTEP